MVLVIQDTLTRNRISDSHGIRAVPRVDQPEAQST